MNKMTFWGRNDEDERLLVECMLGVKTATCTPKVWYDALDEEEKVGIGSRIDVYTKKGLRACTIEMTDLFEIPFGDIKGDIGEKIAKGENSTLEEYIEDHIFSWKDDLQEEGQELNDETVIVVEFFKVIDNFIDFRDLGHRIKVEL